MCVNIIVLWCMVYRVWCMTYGAVDIEVGQYACTFVERMGGRNDKISQTMFVGRISCP